MPEFFDVTNCDIKSGIKYPFTLYYLSLFLTTGIFCFYHEEHEELEGFKLLFLHVLHALHGIIFYFLP